MESRTTMRGLGGTRAKAVFAMAYPLATIGVATVALLAGLFLPQAEAISDGLVAVGGILTVPALVVARARYVEYWRVLVELDRLRPKSVLSVGLDALLCKMGRTGGSLRVLEIALDGYSLSVPVVPGWVAARAKTRKLPDAILFSRKWWQHTLSPTEYW